ncbi:hypothetical protein [Spirillospora sp. CA-294931]|uniref:hypothetical protein n=1 Tax=Spirillospora sp. CA-294931 TaxID=3240042 RepID=UPI003D8AB067
MAIESPTDREAASGEPATGSPVFVDASGRRAKGARRLGVLAGGLLAAYLAVVGTNLMTGADVPLTPWPTGGGSDSADRPQLEKERVTGQRGRGEDRSEPGAQPVPSGRNPQPGASPGRSAQGGRPRSSNAPVVPPAGTTAPSPVPSTASPLPTSPGNSHATPPAHGRDKPKKNPRG